jgi:hypothetical protein
MRGTCRKGRATTIEASLGGQKDRGLEQWALPRVLWMTAYANRTRVAQDTERRSG